jgi:hypothetical protein
MLPLTAGFLPLAVEERGANVAAVLLMFLASSLSNLTPSLAEEEEEEVLAPSDVRLLSGKMGTRFSE